MIVRDYMTTPVITIYEDKPFQEALKLMQDNKIRRLPVVGRSGEIIGIVSERDLLNASPSSATSLTIWEVNYLLAKLTVKEIMTQKVTVVQADTSLDETARLMLMYKVGGLPVVDDDDVVVGVITESDIFKAFIDQQQAHTAVKQFMAREPA